MSFWKIWKKKEKHVNSDKTSVKTIIQQMNEPRPLPMGQKEFVEWTDRIISGAGIPCEDRESLVGVLAAMLMNLGNTESHKPDAYFIHSLRRAAVNEVAHANFRALKEKKAAKDNDPAKVPGPEAAFSEATRRNKEKMSNTKT